MKRTNRLLSILLTLVMMLSLLPAPAQAALDRNTIYSVAVTVDPLVGGAKLPTPTVSAGCTISYEWY